MAFAFPVPYPFAAPGMTMVDWRNSAAGVSKTEWRDSESGVPKQEWRHSLEGIRMSPTAYYAGLAMQGLLSSAVVGTQYSTEEIVRRSFEIGAAMAAEAENGIPADT